MTWSFDCIGSRRWFILENALGFWWAEKASANLYVSPQANQGPCTFWFIQAQSPIVLYFKDDALLLHFWIWKLLFTFASFGFWVLMYRILQEVSASSWWDNRGPQCVSKGWSFEVSQKGMWTDRIDNYPRHPCFLWPRWLAHTYCMYLSTSPLKFIISLSREAWTLSKAFVSVSSILIKHLNTCLTRTNMLLRTSTCDQQVSKIWYAMWSLDSQFWHTQVNFKNFNKLGVKI